MPKHLTQSFLANIWHCYFKLKKLSLVGCVYQLFLLYAYTEGRPVYILCLGQMDIKGLIKAVGEEGIIKEVCDL